MATSRTQFSLWVSGALFALVLSLVACGGGGFSPSAGPQTNPALQGQTVSISLAQSGSIALPASGGITSTIALSQNNAPSGATLNVSVSENPPSGTPSIPVTSVSAFEYFSLSSSATVTFNGFPTISMALPSPAKTQGQFYAWMYNAATKTWTDLGTVTVSGSSLSFGGGLARVTLNAGSTYVVIPFTAKPNVVCPTPGPKQLYVTNANNTITAYDQNGDQVPAGEFINLEGPTDITFDLPNAQFYVTNFSDNRIRVYDIFGNEVVTPAFFDHTNFPIGIAFDSVNRQLYVTNRGNNTITVYDENGNQIRTSSAFPGLQGPLGIAFDSLNKHFYVLNDASDSVTVYDQDGNQIPTSAGSFPNLASPAFITFDSANDHFYVTNRGDIRGSASITEYDQNGSQIFASGGFPDVIDPIGIVFDPDNVHLYVTQSNDTISVYDQDGHRISTPGSFPTLHGPGGLTLVP